MTDQTSLPLKALYSFHVTYCILICCNMAQIKANLPPTHLPTHPRII